MVILSSLHSPHPVPGYGTALGRLQLPSGTQQISPGFVGLSN